jgi:hypothetical protein
LDTKRKTAISRGVKRTGRGRMPSIICRAINHPATMGEPFSHSPFRGDRGRVRTETSRVPVKTSTGPTRTRSPRPNTTTGR